MTTPATQNATRHLLSLHTDWGVFHATFSDAGLAALCLPQPQTAAPTSHPTHADLPAHLRPLARDLHTQISEYLAHRRTSFDIPLDLRGTDFQLATWRQLQAIPYAGSLTYAQVAHAIERPRAVRAVGNACGANPVPLLVPCHRVLASHGRLGGYSGGLHWKCKLLQLEGIPFHNDHLQ